LAWVLIMEDETQVRVLAEEILKEAGHQTLSAANVPEALALLRAYELITVLFADINLEEGGPNGLELAQKAVAMRPKLKVLYTTGADVTDGTRALRRGLSVPAQTIHTSAAHRERRSSLAKLDGRGINERLGILLLQRTRISYSRSTNLRAKTWGRGMFSDIAIEIFERVEECRFEARRAVHAEDKAAWIALAEDWLRLGQNTADDLAAEAPLEGEQKLAPA